MWLINEMLLENSKPLWKHVFKNTVFYVFTAVFIKWEQNDRVLGTYTNNHYKNAVKSIKMKPNSK